MSKYLEIVKFFNVFFWILYFFSCIFRLISNRTECDLIKERQVQRRKAIALAEKYNMVYIECSLHPREPIKISEIFKIITLEVMMARKLKSQISSKTESEKRVKCSIQ